MTYLLDTQIFLWAALEPERLSRSVQAILNQPGSDLVLSVVSAWEIAIKYQLGRLPMARPPEDFVPAQMADQRLRVLPVSLPHALRVHALPLHHRDPFDRMLVAQAEVEGLTVLTADHKIESYGVATIF